MVKVTDTKTQSLNVNHGIWQVYVCIFNCHFIHFLLAKNKKAKLYTRCAKLLEKIEYAIICGTVINKIGRLRFPASTFASTKEKIGRAHV